MQAQCRMSLSKVAQDIDVPKVHPFYSACRVTSRCCSISSKRSSHEGSSLAAPNHSHGTSSGRVPEACGKSSEPPPDLWRSGQAAGQQGSTIVFTPALTPGGLPRSARQSLTIPILHRPGAVDRRRLGPRRPPAPPALLPRPHGIGASCRQRRGPRAPPLRRARRVGGHRLAQGRTPPRVWPSAVVGRRQEQAGLGQSGGTRARAGAAPSERRPPLPPAPRAPFPHRRVALPATRRQALLPRGGRATYAPVCALDQALTPPGLHHLGRAHRRPRHRAGPGGGARGPQGAEAPPAIGRTLRSGTKRGGVSPGRWRPRGQVMPGGGAPGAGGRGPSLARRRHSAAGGGDRHRAWGR